MSPLLFPLLLLLYGEGSEDKVTRLTARVLFYGYSVSILLFTILPEFDYNIILASLPYFVSYGYIFYTSKQTSIKILTGTLFVLQGISFTSIYFNSYELLLLIPFYFEYSNIILREFSIILLGMCTADLKTDSRLKILTFIFYFVEYSYITGF